MSPLSDQTADRYLSRVWVFSAILALLGTTVVAWRWGATFAVSFLLGAAVAVVNLRWLEFSVKRVMDSAEASAVRAIPINPEQPERDRSRAQGEAAVQIAEEEAHDLHPAVTTPRPRLGLWPKLVARYLFLGAVAYVILKGHFLSGSAVLAGLFVPIAALMLEAIYEGFAAFRG